MALAIAILFVNLCAAQGPVLCYHGSLLTLLPVRAERNEQSKRQLRRPAFLFVQCCAQKWLSVLVPNGNERSGSLHWKIHVLNSILYC